MPTFKINHLAVISLPTQDVALTTHFYQEVIGLTRLAQHGHQPAFDLGNGLYLVIVEGQAEARLTAQDRDFPALAFAVDDLDQAVEQLGLHNVEMPWGIQKNPQNRWVKFHDPGGNLIELAQFGT